MIDPPPNSAEWMDDPTLSVDDLRATMTDQSLLHRWLGGHGAVLGKVRRFQSRHPGPVRILELACGAGDLLQEVGKAVSDASGPTHRLGMDRSLPVLRVAREMHPGPDYVIGDLLAPPFPDRSFDLVLLPHALHHLDRDDAVMALREAARVTRGMLLVLDLVPSRLA
ncbi:MAG: class I SAM-dependent methyltransferase, partial [Longimicrobiales bacterium]